MLQPRYVAVDWGTSSFRLWLIGDRGVVLSESRSAEGMIAARDIGFETVLDTHLANVGAPDDVPVILCGMVGAKQGWLDAGYVDVPGTLHNIPMQARKVPAQARDMRVIPGLAQRNRNAADVMRGEETQLLGLQHDMQTDRLVAMPGTHSKWVRVTGGTVTSFSTYMTGEMFSLIAKHSILQHSIAGSPGVDATSPAFLSAVDTAYRHPERATSLLFSIRAQGLLNALPAQDAEAALSGTLIGLELAGALDTVATDTQIILLASGTLRDLYRSALAHIGRTFEQVDADEAVRRGLAFAAQKIWAFDKDTSA